MFIEFSYPINSKSQNIFLGIKDIEIIPRSRIMYGSKNNTSFIKLFSHLGTHIDVPWHFNEKGYKIMDFSIEEFNFSKVQLINISKNLKKLVGIKEFKKYEKELSLSDCLLIYTGFSRYRNLDKKYYFQNTPGISLDAAKYLATFKNLHCIGVDFISIENIIKGRRINFPVHNILLKRLPPIILLEDANIFPLVNKDIFRIYLFPLRIENLEASPVTAVAEIVK